MNELRVKHWPSIEKNRNKTVHEKTFVSQQWEHDWSQNLVSLLKEPYRDRKPSFRALASRLAKLHTVLAWLSIDGMTIAIEKSIDQNCLFLDDFYSDGNQTCVGRSPISVEVIC